MELFSDWQYFSHSMCRERQKKGAKYQPSCDWKSLPGIEDIENFQRG